MFLYNKEVRRHRERFDLLFKALASLACSFRRCSETCCARIHYCDDDLVASFVESIYQLFVVVCYLFL